MPSRPSIPQNRRSLHEHVHPAGRAPRPPRRGVRRVRRVRSRRRRGAHDVLRLASAAASRSGERRHRRGRRCDGHGVERPRPCDPGVRRSKPGRARGLRGRGPRALLHERRRRVVGGCAAAHLGHRRRADRARAQRHARQHERLARPSRRRGRAVPFRHRQRGGGEGNRPGDPGNAPLAQRHPPRYGGAVGRLRHGAGQPRFAVRVPRPQRYPPAVHRRAARRPRLGGVQRDVRARHRGRAVRARRRTGRDRALQPRRHARRAGRCRPQVGGVHLRVRVLRAPRQRDRRPERVPGAAQHGAHSGAGGARGGRPRAGRARLGRAVGHGLRV